MQLLRFQRTGRSDQNHRILKKIGAAVEVIVRLVTSGALGAKEFVVLAVLAAGMAGAVLYSVECYWDLQDDLEYYRGRTLIAENNLNTLTAYYQSSCTRDK